MKLRPGLVILADKGFAGQDFEQLVSGYGARLLRPDRADEPQRHGSLGRWRQWIESTLDILKDQLGLECHRGRTLAGVYVRIAQRLLALATAIWWIWEIGALDKRSLAAYDHQAPSHPIASNHLAAPAGPFAAVPPARTGKGGCEELVTISRGPSAPGLEGPRPG